MVSTTETVLIEVQVIEVVVVAAVVVVPVVVAIVLIAAVLVRRRMAKVLPRLGGHSQRNDQSNERVLSSSVGDGVADGQTEQHLLLLARLDGRQWTGGEQEKDGAEDKGLQGKQ